MPHTLEPIITVEHIAHWYGNTQVLTDVTLAVHRGDYLALIGPNGGGKTTLLKIMLGLIRPRLGTVNIFGHDICRFKDWNKIGYVPQKNLQGGNLFPATVAEIVRFGLVGSRSLRKNAAEKIKLALARVGLEDSGDHLIGELSPGRQQRALIARALVNDPEVLVLDEPTVGVDVAAQEQFYALLRTLHAEAGLTLILVSHDIDVAASQSTELACINNRLMYHGPPDEFMTKEGWKQLYGKELKFIVHGH